MTKKQGRPTKYSEELAEKIAEELAHSTIKEACKKHGIVEDTYYQWLYKYEKFSELSTKARKTKAVKHFSKCEDILDMMENKYYDEDIRSDLLRLKLDFHLRLAGKANQGLFGDSAKNSIQVNVDNKDVDVPIRQTQEEWEANLQN